MSLGPALMLAISLWAAPEPGLRRYSQLEIKDMEALAPVLKAQVAEVTVELRQAGPLLGATERIGYAVPWGEGRLVLLSAIVEGAQAIRVRGPKGEAVRAELLLYDPTRRVAILGVQAPLSALGLRQVPPVPAPERRVDDEIFALISTAPESGVVYGVITQSGKEPEYEGHPRVDLKLEQGMPVFDDRARFVGYSRVVAFDQDRFMLITPEQIKSAQTATASVDRRSRAPAEPKRPWWAK